MAQKGFWDDKQLASVRTKELKNLKSQAEFWEKLEKDVGVLEELAHSTPSQSPPIRPPKAERTGGERELEKMYSDLKSLYDQARLTTFFSGKYDDHDAIVSIHAGAGGLDAQDWAEMLLRMYLRSCEKKGFKTLLVDESRNPEGGVKSATFEAKGDPGPPKADGASFAYGYLKSEAGVHRLIRLSPFNPAHTRETSFALVEVLPILEASEEELSLDPKDLKIETKTASGHGGQSVNTTYSAVRITHLPTNLTVSIQNERSRTQNKAQALRILKAKLKKLEEERQLEEKLKLRGEFKSAEWGNQIRSYTLHPYKLVKDHRTGLETSDTDAVLDGNLDEFVEKYLESDSNDSLPSGDLYDN